ncbi:phosphatidylglycerol lysyltransferase domain-containing protein [Streptomyces sp. NPDC059917]|uniref:phosphatidylglycerol lysyltransferase domain-containing protein n=1 Tax=Streptomyces sp. NPDC059917 TaxID=3347002 RepID=UPI0036471575
MSQSPRFHEVVEHLRAHSDNPSGFLTLNSTMRYYRGVETPGIVAYAAFGRHTVLLGNPLAPADRRVHLLDEFRAREARCSRSLTVTEIRGHDAQTYARRGFAVNQIGSSYSIDLTAFSLRGRALAKVRQNTARARREGVAAEEVAKEFPVGPALDAVDAFWLRGKGKGVKEFAFFIGEREEPGVLLARVFVARHRGRIVAYASYYPAYGTQPGWIVDRTRRMPDAPVGTTELLNLTALETFQREGAAWLHLGLTPLAGLDPLREQTTANRLLSRGLALAAGNDRILYPSRSQLAYKMKWAPHDVQPEYVAFDRRMTAPALWNLLKVLGAV